MKIPDASSRQTDDKKNWKNDDDNNNNSPSVSNLAIPRGDRVQINLTCSPAHLGQEERLLLFDFGRFQIGRTVRVDVKPPETHLYHHKLTAAMPYFRKTKDDVVEVSPPSSSSTSADVYDKSGMIDQPSAPIPNPLPRTSVQMQDAAKRLMNQVSNKALIPGERPMFDRTREKMIIKTPHKLPPFEIPFPVQEAGKIYEVCDGVT